MEIGMFNLWSHPGNTELNQIAKLPFLFATISADWALTNAVLLLKGPNSSAAGAQWCLCVFLLLMNNKDWPPHFPLAPSHCTLHHDWGSGGPLSNVDISQANAMSVKHWMKQSAKISFTPPWSPKGCPVKALLLYQSLATLWVVHSAEHRSAWVVFMSGLNWSCSARSTSIYGAVEHTHHPWKQQIWPKGFFCC